MSITSFKINLDFPRQIFQGDSFDFELTVDANLNGYKCRVSVFDKDSNEIKLATANVTGGADTQVLITAGTISTIKVYVPKDETDSFNEDSFVEIEIEDANGKVYTILKHSFEMLEEKLTWTSTT